MSGYREPRYDPDAYELWGRPPRPYNKVQWAGVVIAGAGFILSCLDLAVTFGWTPRLLGLPSISNIMLIIIGVSLMNSRREPSTDLAPELAAARRRWLILIVSLCAIVLGIASIIEFSGAR